MVVLTHTHTHKHTHTIPVTESDYTQVYLNNTWKMRQKDTSSSIEKKLHEGWNCIRLEDDTNKQL